MTVNSAIDFLLETSVDVYYHGASAAVKMSASQIDILTRTSKVGSYLVFDLDLQIGNKSEFDLVIDPIENHAQVRTALVKANEQLG